MNKLAEKLTEINVRQFESCVLSKRRRVKKIAKYRQLYNVNPERQLRVRYDAPLPIFSGMIDTLLASLNDTVTIKFQETDPADWRAARKASAAVQKLSDSQMPGGQWDKVFRSMRKEAAFTGVGIGKYVPFNLDNKFHSQLENVTFEHAIFQTRGGYNIENHNFFGQDDIWLTKSQLLKGVLGGIYDKEAVDYCLSLKPDGFQSRGSLTFEEEARFKPLGIDANEETVGEPTLRFIEIVSEYEGKRWYNLFEYFTRKSIRFAKLADLNSSELLPWFSFATHEDSENFASKSYADDLYPHAVSINDLFNEEQENRRLRNSGARAYDKDMFTNPQKLYEAQIGRSKLVPADTQNGTRRIADGIFEFKSPEITGTVDLINWVKGEVGTSTGINDLLQGAPQPVTKKVGVTYVEQSNIGKRLSFAAQPIQEAMVQLGYKVFAGLKDYLREPLPIKLFGEEGDKWDLLKRIDLHFERDFEITVVSQSQTNQKNEMAKQSREKALNMLMMSPNINGRVRDEYIARDIGGYTETEIALLLDTTAQTTKDSVSISSEAVQDIMMGRVPQLNYQADTYFLNRIIDYVETHLEDKNVKKKMKQFLDYIDRHKAIVEGNMRRKQQEKSMQMAAEQNAQPTQEPQQMPQQMPSQMPNTMPNAPQITQ